MPHNNSLYPTSGRAWFTVSILLVAYVLSFIDRQVLNLLVEPIRRDLAISDTQMSLLMGLSFAIFYTIAGIPLGRVADSKSRLRPIPLWLTASHRTVKPGKHWPAGARDRGCRPDSAIPLLTLSKQELHHD